MYKKILVPLDGSPVAEQILPEVKELAKLTGAEIQLLRVTLVHVLPGADPTDKEVIAVREAEKYLEEIQAGLEKEGLNASVHVRYGHDAGEILDHSQKVDLVAMCTHGRTGLGRWTLGSVAERVVRHSGKPVLLVRAA
ncbi:MAG: universal stress protein [Deltaproteobacteria bacterium]|nr:universal stress protein [Deltaproteobacteria bacterium]